MAGVRTCAHFSSRLSPHTPLTRLRIFHSQGGRCSSSTTDAPTPAHATFKASDLQIDFCRPEQLRSKPPVKELLFGKSFTDHMLKIYYTKDSGWGAPRIMPLQDLRLHPAAKVLHYSVELFEGMKAFRGVDDEIRLFRPNMNMARMNRTAARSALPTFNGEELVALLKKLVSVDQEWVPHTESSSLYIRPTMIGTEPTLGVVRPAEALLFVILSPVGPYFASGFKPVSLLADPRYVRAWPGGVGDMKMGSNYGPTLEIQRQAEQQGCQQVLWLFGPEHRITEVGAMNIMVFLVNDQGEKELVTPPLDGLILPGVTRDSLLTLARSWGEFRVTERDITMGEVEQASEEGRLIEMFGAGTAAVVTPVGEIHYQGRVIRVTKEGQKESLAQRFYNTITGIQYGKVKSDWAVSIDS
ncbi:LOW QUALITY PROTEIN: branched-chain-amino-acid aminotransferase, cytosolic-like [Scylla paramamosain]|uniref:LOW QUALITY PROTEIN: branched-chain-amino-acid aminotransferase, cytosolic-like n=1 Tax=Scylla paramamosain TaxID=85552 RepID=UPI003083EC4E